MKLKTRRIMLIACIILFFLLFPAIALLSFGYRYDTNENKIVQTGVIYITANPQDNIKITINGKEEKERISVKGIFKKDYVLYNLMPQNYDIRVSKDGYSSWEKRLTVSPGVITYAKPLLLQLKPADNLLFNDSNIIGWSLSPDFKKIAYLKNTDGKIYFSVYNTEVKATASVIFGNTAPDFEKTLIQNPDLKTHFSWDSNSKNIIIEASSKTSEFIALNTSNDKITYLGKIQTDAKITKYAWNQNNDLFIFNTDKNELYTANILSDPDKAVKIADNVSGFTTKNNNIYYLDAKSFFVYSFSFDDPANKKQISLQPLPSLNAADENISASRSQIIISERSDIAIISAGKNLFIVTQKNGIPIKINDNIDSANFSKNGDTLLYNSSYEIFTYLINDDTENLVTRLAQKVDEVDWYKDYEHIWFINSNILKNIELDSRPVPNIIDFVNFSASPENFIYDPNSNTIYYDQIDTDKLSIYQLVVGN